MTNGLGTGFTVVFVLAVLAGLAILLSLVTVAGLVLDRRGEQVPRLLRYTAIILMLEVVSVAVVGIVSFVSGATVAAAMLATLVILPLAAITFRARRTTRLSGIRLVTTVAMSWGPPFLVGLSVFFAVTQAVESLVVPGAETSALVGVGLFAAMVGGVVVLVGVGWLTSRLAKALEKRETTGTDREA